MPRYYRRHWDEPRGDDHDDWGTSTWYFEVDADGRVTRQIEVYASGVVKRYDDGHPEDSDGARASEALDEVAFAQYRVAAATFEAVWSSR